MAQQNEKEKSTKDKVRKIVKEVVSSFVSEIVQHYVKKRVIELKDTFSGKRIRRIEERSIKDVLKDRLDTRLSETLNQVSNEIAKDGATWEDIGKGTEWALENGLKKYFWSISRLISLKTIVVAAVTLSTLGGGAIFAAIFFHTLTVNISGEGTVDHSLDAQRYAYGTEVTVSAQPAAGWEFDCWEGDVSSTSPILTVTMDRDKNITACFTRLYGFMLSINVVGLGSTDPPTGDCTYDAGTLVNVTARPASGWEFDCWEGDVSSTSPILTVTMTSRKNITAYFTKIKVTLSASVSPLGSGSVSPSSGTYDAGTLVNVTARPASGWEFDCWEGDVSSTSPILTVTMTSRKNITACFTKIKVTLSASVSPLGSGSVSPSSGTYDAGTLVNVTARPASGWEFDCWEGDVSSTSPILTVTMTSRKNITAYFTKIKYTLSTSVSPLGSGSVSPSSGTYDAGTRVNVTANPATGWKFDHWSGTDNDYVNPTTVTMNFNKTVTAHFIEHKYSLSTQVSGSGSISPDRGTFEAGIVVTLYAWPSTFWKFDHWGGDALGTSPSITVTMTSDKNITAYFTKINTLSTSVSPLGSGSVSPSSGTYDLGTRVNVTANPATGWEFDHWSGTDNDNINPTTVTMTSDKNITAYFTKIKYTLSTSVNPSGYGSVSPSSGTYDAGTRVNITANPSIFWKFDHWSGTDNDKINPTTVTMTSNKPVTAYFTKFYSYNTQLILAGSGNYTIEGDLDVVKIAVISGASWDCAVVALNTYSITYGITYQRIYIPGGEIYEALARGIIDAVLAAGHPSMFVPEDVSVLEWSNDAIYEVMKNFPDTTVATLLPKDTYSGQGADIKGYALR